MPDIKTTLAKDIEAENSGKPDKSHHQLISMLDTLLAKMDADTKKKKLQEEHNLPMTIKLEKELNDMCNLSSGVREEGFRDGFNNGFNNGFHDGEINTLKNMLQAGLTTIEKLKESGLYSPEILTALRN